MHRDKNVLIIGSNGRLGRALLDACQPSFLTCGLTRHDLDLAWSDPRIRAALDRHEPDLVMLSAGATSVDQCEFAPEEAHQLNVACVDSIARWCADRGVRFISFSSDYVFDGEKSSPYEEGDAARPLSVYGQTKAEGEAAALAASDRNLVVRLTWLYGPGKALATPDWAVELAVKQETLNVVSDRVGCPSYTGDMAQALLPLLFDEEASGLLHLCNAGSCTWQEWAQHCIDLAAACGVPLKARKVGALSMDDLFGDRATRPRYTVLSTARYESLSGQAPPDWRVPLRRYIETHVAPRFLRN